MKLRTIIFLAVFSFITSSASALSITCSTYPVYDFTRNITGDLAEVKLLLPPGTEPHEFEPSPSDIKALYDSDVFVFTGRYMEQWADRISGILNDTIIIDASENIELLNNNPHVWLDLSLAQKMIENITLGLSKIDPEHSDIYRQNSDIYCSKLAELDKRFMSIKKGKALVFAGEFSCEYFVRRYGFDYLSAYDGENEPSIKRMSEVMKYIRDNKTRYIFADALEVSSITRSISEETGAEILTFNTAHQVKDKNITFLEIMTENYNNISRALNDD